MTEIAQVVVPGVPQEQAMEVMDRCMDGEMARLRGDRCHTLYPGVKETLTELHKTHTPVYRQQLPAGLCASC